MVCFSTILGVYMLLIAAKQLNRMAKWPYYRIINEGENALLNCVKIIVKY